jgi:hypothetical protein
MMSEATKWSNDPIVFSGYALAAYLVCVRNAALMEEHEMIADLLGSRFRDA